MPRKQRRRAPPELAVSASPFFTLPPEVRRMIYELLLVQEQGIAIAHDVFKRMVCPRDSNRPSDCAICGRLFSSRLAWKLHKDRTVDHGSDIGGSSRRLELPDLPMLSISIIHTCRVIHDEATPILYQGNSFCFSDHETADSFRWGTDAKYAGLTREINVNCKLMYIEWQAQLIWKNLGRNFLHLRRLVIRLGAGDDYCFPQALARELQEVAQNFRGLDCVHVQSFMSSKILKFLYPIVDKQHDTAQGVLQVQKHVTTVAKSRIALSLCLGYYLMQVGVLGDHDLAVFKDATLWWGRAGEETPKIGHSIRSTRKSA